MSGDSANRDGMICLTVKRLKGLPSRSWIHSPGKRKWYITMNIGNFIGKTPIQTRQTGSEFVSWDHPFQFTIPSKMAKASPQVSLYRAHKHRNDELVAVLENFDLVKRSEQKEFSIKFFRTSNKAAAFGDLVASVRIKLPVQTTGQGSPPYLSAIQLRKCLEAPKAWQSFLRAFQQAIELARPFSELNNTAKAAVGVCTFVFTALMNQIERDARVEELREQMTTLLEFFTDAGTLRLEANAFLRGVLGRLIRQASECTYFIFQYQEIESFVQRTAIHLTGGTDDILDRFFATFSILRAELAFGMSLQVAINTEYILNRVDDIEDLLLIEPLQALKKCSWRDDKQCAPGTRDPIINQIHAWVSDFEQGAFVLIGPAGCGKTTIANTVAGLFDELGRLGACVFLNEGTEGSKTADAVMSTLLHCLGRSNPYLKRRIAAAVGVHPSLNGTNAGRYQKLLAGVLRDLVLYGPLLIVIDGLHELEPKDQQTMYAILNELAQSSRSKLRILVTSRVCPRPMKHGNVLLRIRNLTLQRIAHLFEKAFSKAAK